MKYFQALVALLIIQVTFGQWDFEESGNNFDGIVKMASVRGAGSAQYYRYPSLVINNFINAASGINFYLNNTGYYQERTGVGVEFYFDNQTKVYEVSNLSISGDGNSLFMNSFTERNKPFPEITKIEMIGMFKKYSQVTFRVSDRFGSSTVKFSLSGSTSAINKAIPDIDNMLEVINSVKEKERNYANTKVQFRDSILELLRKDKFTDISLNSIKDELDKYLNLGDYDSPYRKKYSRIIDFILNPKLIDGKFEGDFDIFVKFSDLSQETVFGRKRVQPDSPWFSDYDNKVAQQFERQYRYIEDLDEKFQKFKIPRLIEAVYKQARSKSISSYPSWTIDEIDSLKATISRPFRDKIMDLKVIFYVNKPDMWPEIRNTITVRNLNITVEELKEVGLKPLIEF